MLYGLVVHFYFLDTLRVDVGCKFLADGLKKDHKPGHFDTAARTAGTGADKHQKHKDHLAGCVPCIEIGRRETGRRNDGRDLERGLCQRLESIGAQSEDVEEDDRNRNEYDQKIVPDLFHFQRALDLAEKDQVIGVEIDAEEDHEDGNDPLDIGRIIGYTGIFDTKTAGPGRAETGAYGIKQGHFPEDKEQRFDHGHAQIDQVQITRRGFYFGNKLADRRAGAFRPHQIDVGSAAQRNDRKKEYKDSHAADPVRKAAPEQRAMGKRFHIAQNTCSGSRKAGDRFKQRVGEGRDLLGEEKRKTAEKT